jgi:hypothetical protein
VARFYVPSECVLTKEPLNIITSKSKSRYRTTHNSPSTLKDSTSSMSSEVHSTPAFDDCAEYHALATNLIRAGEGFLTPAQEHLEEIHTAILMLRDTFITALRKADAFVHSASTADEIMTTIRGTPPQDYSRDIPEEKWNPELVKMYLEDLRKLYLLERKVRYAKDSKELFDLPIVQPRMLSTYRTGCGRLFTHIQEVTALANKQWMLGSKEIAV